MCFSMSTIFSSLSKRLNVTLCKNRKFNNFVYSVTLSLLHPDPKIFSIDQNAFYKKIQIQKSAHLVNPEKNSTRPFNLKGKKL